MPSATSPCSSALGRTRWPGRLEKVASAPDLWIDVGHTPRALEAVTRTFLEFSPRDKDTGRSSASPPPRRSPPSAETVAIRFDHFILTRAHKAGADTSLFEQTFRQRVAGRTIVPDTSAAARLAKERALREGLTVLALGGLFLSAEIQHAWKGGEPQRVWSSF